MEKIFESAAPYTAESYRELLVFSCRIRLRKYAAVCILFATACIAFSIYEIARGNMLLFVLMLLWGVLLLFYPLILGRRAVGAAMKNALNQESALFGLTYTTSFYDNRLEVRSQQSGMTFYYDQIYKAYETSGCFYIYLDKMQIVGLPKGSFTVGTPQALSEFLRDKLGKRFCGRRQK